MTVGSFARQVSSYIDFNTVLKVIHDVENNKAAAYEKSVLLLGSEHIKKAEDWDLYNLLKDFLSEFSIPKESIEFILQTHENLSIDDPIIKWLLNYRFTGELRGNPKLQNQPNNLSFTPLVAIVAESCILDILYYPLNFLINTVEVLSETWQKVKELKARAYLEPGTPSELLVYIEKRIASHYEYLEKYDAGERAGNSVFNGYRYVCLTSNLPVNDKLLKVAQEASFHQGKLTLS